MPPLARFTDPTQPDAVPGIASTLPGSLERTLRVREYFDLAPLSTERGLILSADGTLRFETEGKSTEVEFPLRKLLNGVVTHNHPAGKSLSLQDIVDVAVDGNVQEIRAVGRYALPAAGARTYVYRAVRPEAGWPSKKAIREAFRKSYSSLERALDREIRRGKLSYIEANFEHLHRVWTRVGKSLKFTYERVLLDP